MTSSVSHRLTRLSICSKAGKSEEAVNVVDHPADTSIGMKMKEPLTALLGLLTVVALLSLRRPYISSTYISAFQQACREVVALRGGTADYIDVY